MPDLAREAREIVERERGVSHIEQSLVAMRRSEEALEMREQGMKLREIGLRMGVGRERARQLVDRALRARKAVEMYGGQEDMRPLSTRARNCLAFAELRTREEVRAKSADELLLIRGVGVKVAAELIRWAAEEVGER